MKKILLSMVIFLSMFGLVGCEVDEKTQNGIVSSLKKEGYVPKEAKKVGISKVCGGNFSGMTTCSTYDVYEANGELLSIYFYDNTVTPYRDSDKRCEYIIKISNDVTLLKNQEIVEKSYDNENKKYITTKKIEDVYETNIENEVKYCANKKTTFLFFKDYSIEENN